MKRTLPAILALAILLLLPLRAAAAAQPDPARECSITVYLKTVADEPVCDGSVQLLQVAVLRENAGELYYEQNEGFGTLAFDPMAEWYKEGTAEKLAEIAVKNGLPSTAAPCSEQGIAVFSHLAPGLYLLMQTEAVLKSYTAITPCLMLVPQEQKDGSLLYDAPCYPKPVTSPPPEESTTAPDETTTAPDETTTAPDETTTAPSEPTTKQPEKPQIPRTGQLWWPVAALGFAGTALTAAGIAALRKKENA